MRPVVLASDPPSGAVSLVWVSGGVPLVTSVIEGQTPASLGFEGDPNETLLVAGPQGRVLLVGLGEDPDAATLRLAAGAAGRALDPGEAVETTIPAIEGAAEAVIEGFLAGSYHFDGYRSKETVEPGALTVVGGADQAVAERSRVVSRAVYRARDWVNRPSGDKAPAVLAAEMGERLSGSGHTVEIWDEVRIGDERLGGLVGVAAGSDRPPRFLVARSGDGRRRPHLALVGKGIVFDSGGLSIKTAEGMETMKGDMAGAAAVVAAAEAIASLGPGIAVSVFVPLSDNMSGGSAMKPGDVLTVRNGKTIEVLNTDAEGRLVLADALSLAAEADPDLIVDVATLTGASRVALGDRIAAVFASSEDIRLQVTEAAERAGERVWPLPLPPDYRRLIDSTVADMKNTGGRYGGAIAAALLLSEFVGELPWAHLDIAGPSYLREDGPLGPRGGSGFGVPTLIALADALSGVRPGTPH